MTSLKLKEVICLLYSTFLFISGVLLITFSILLSYRIFFHFNFIPSSTIGPFIVIFLIGIVHLFVPWLGIKGPTREHDFHIILFMVITLLLLIVECSVGIWSIVLWDEVDVQSLQLLTKSFDELIKSDFHKKDWSRLESKFKCCGINGVTEYKEIKNVIPLSCCNLDSVNSTCPEVFEIGCKTPLIKYVKRLLIDSAAMGFSCCILQGFGVFVFYTFFRALKEERRERIKRRLEVQRRASHENGNTSQATSTSAPQSPVVTTS